MERATSDDVDFLFLLDESAPGPARLARAGAAVAGSLLIHALVLGALFVLPAVPPPAGAPVVLANIRRSVQLVAPRPFELTQKDPNQGKVTRELDIRSAVSTPRPQAPRFVPRAPDPGPPEPAAAPAPVIEPPKIEVAAAAPLPSGGRVQELPPPAQKPKLTFESLASASVRSPSTNPAVSLPKPSVSDTTKAPTRPSGAGGTTVGDVLEAPPNITLPGGVPDIGKLGSQLQLLSDDLGTDFKPYLIQVLTAVRHNWMAVIPESARMGRQGRVLVQFIIDREGRVPKLVIASPSGTLAFDRAAVAGVSASYPFPALPADFKGTEIRLQLAFSYNMPR